MKTMKIVITITTIIIITYVGIYIETMLFQFASHKEPYAIRMAFPCLARAIANGPHTGIFSVVSQ